MQPPKLFDRDAAELLAEAQALAPVYTPDWTGAGDPVDAGHALMVLAARLIEVLSDRINRVPEKNLLAFLDLVGVERSPGLPAEVPVTFLLSERTVNGELVPARTQVATTQSEAADAQVFETRNAFFATPALLTHVLNVVPGADQYSVLTPLPAPPTPADIADPARPIEVLTKDSSAILAVPHELYLASKALFARSAPADIEMVFTVDNGQFAIFNVAHLTWQRFDAQTKQWVDISNVTYPSFTPTTATVRFAAFPGTGTSSVAGDEDAWIVGRLKTSPSTLPGLPVLSQITGSVATAAAPATPPDATFFNDIALDLSKPARPFGDRPRYGDAFHVGSTKAFGPGVASATLHVTLRLYTLAEIQAMFAKITADTTVTTTVEWQYLATGGLWKTLPSATFTHVLKATVGNPPGITQLGPTNVAATANEKAYTLFGTLGGAATVDIPFTVPSDMAEGKVGGITGRWVRALLKTTSPYGRDAVVTFSGTTPVVVGPTFMPPIVEKIEIDYQYSTSAVPLDRVTTSNNFEFVKRSSPVFGASGPLAPFVALGAYLPQGIAASASPFLAGTPGLYLAFDRAFGSAFISVLLALVEPTSTAQLMPEIGEPRIAWEYLSAGNTWRPLDVRDGTADLTSTGVVGFAAPADAIPLMVFSQLTGSPRYWYRARLQSGSYTAPPRLAAVLPNTVMTDNQQTIQGDWILTSGSGEPNQRATILRRPVLAGDIWVREDEVPADTELDELVEELQQRALEEGQPTTITRADVLDRRGVGTAAQEIWVRWLRVPNFHVSGARSRHHTMDAASGAVMFGGGTFGLIPAIGKDNIVVRGLVFGGGEPANRIAVPLAIKELKTSLPFVASVFNLTRAAGGSDPWTFDQIFDLGPQAIKNRGRAVSAEDYEWVVLAAFGQVARSRALATKKPDPGGVLTFKPGAVSIIIVPKGPETTPQPSKGLLRRIESYLRRRAFGAILEEIYALPPVYTQVSIAASVVPRTKEETSLVERRVVQALEAFFHPLTGGERREGWPFGRSVFLSEVFAVIERTDGVDHVVSAAFVGAPGLAQLDVGENVLVASGTHHITMV